GPGAGERRPGRRRPRRESGSAPPVDRDLLGVAAVHQQGGDAAPVLGAAADLAPRDQRQRLFGQVVVAGGMGVGEIDAGPGGLDEYDLNVAHTEDTQLGVFGEFEPKLSDASKAADVLFLANIQPDLQRQVRAQCTEARFYALDSMNLWIDTARDSLLAAISEV